MEKKKFNVRGFISLLTACSFILMSVTGIVLYFTPQGRIAFWTNWKFIGLTRINWVDIHVLSCLLFLVAGVYHVYNNWRSLWHYVWDRLGRTMPLMRELILSVMITVLITIGAIYLFPPFDYVITFSDFLKSSWVKSKEYEPPIGHAELLSLKAFSKKMHIDLSKAVQELKSKGIILDEDGNQSLEIIAKKNETSPHDLYVLIRKFEAKSDDEGSAGEPLTRDRAGLLRNESADTSTLARAKEPSRWVYTEEIVIKRFEGKGVGKMTVKGACEETGVDVKKALEKLSEKGIRAKESDTFRQIATKNNMLPIKVLSLILLGEEIKDQ